MRWAAVPLPLVSSVPVHVPPRLKRTLCPGWSTWLLALASVRHGALGEVPLFASFPAATTVPSIRSCIAGHTPSFEHRPAACTSTRAPPVGAAGALGAGGTLSGT